jgi:hypothetical protein
LKVSKVEVNSAYAIMQWCDALSLILCQRQLPTAGRAIEISRGPDGRRYDAIQREDAAKDDGSKSGSACTNLTVQPWPFQPSEFTVSIEASYLDQLTFKSNAELQAALRGARIEPITWRFLQ